MKAVDYNEKIKELEIRVGNIEARNKRVEGDKAWETSRTRSIFIAISTYLLIFAFMNLIGDNHPFLNAFVASVGYILSTATYGFLKKRWLAKKNKGISIS